MGMAIYLWFMKVTGFFLPSTHLYGTAPWPTFKVLRIQIDRVFVAKLLCVQENQQLICFQSVQT